MSGVVACGVWHTHPGVHFVQFAYILFYSFACFSLERQTCIEYFFVYLLIYFLSTVVPVTINETKSVCVLFKCKCLYYLCRAKALDGCGRSLKLKFELSVKQTLMII